MSIPKSVRENDQARLIVDGRPFIVLGAQWDYRLARDRAHRKSLFPLAKKINCNTAFIPIFWEQIEPARDIYDFHVVEEILAEARGHGLRLVLLWFGSNREGCCGHGLRQPEAVHDAHSAFISQVPDYILDDPATYPRAISSDGRPHPWSLCPSGSATLTREAKAFSAFLAHLAVSDLARTAIMIQINNEICTPPLGDLRFSDGCSCPDCQAQRGSTRLADSASASATSYARYIESMAAAGSAVYPLPMYVNFVADPRPGEDIQVFLDEAPHLACVGSDAYAENAAHFRRIMKRFRIGRNVSFVAETSSDEYTATEKNLLIGLGEFGLIGLDLWAIDCPYGYGAWLPDHRVSAPLFMADGTPAGRALSIAEVFGLVDRANEIVAQHLGTNAILPFLGEEGGGAVSRRWPEGMVEIRFSPDGLGLLIRTGPGEYTLLGKNCRATFPISVTSAERGSWRGQDWMAAGSIPKAGEGDERKVRLAEADVVRIKTGPRRER